MVEDSRLLSMMAILSGTYSVDTFFFLRYEIVSWVVGLVLGRVVVSAYTVHQSQANRRLFNVCLNISASFCDNSFGTCTFIF